MSHQNTKKNQESTVGERGLPAEKDMGEGLKTLLNPEQNKKKLQLDRVEKTKETDTIEDSRFRGENVDHSVGT